MKKIFIIGLTFIMLSIVSLYALREVPECAKSCANAYDKCLKKLNQEFKKSNDGNKRALDAERCVKKYDACEASHCK